MTDCRRECRCHRTLRPGSAAGPRRRPTSGSLLDDSSGLTCVSPKSSCRVRDNGSCRIAPGDPPCRPGLGISGSSLENSASARRADGPVRAVQERGARAAAGALRRELGALVGERGRDAADGSGDQPPERVVAQRGRRGSRGDRGELAASACLRLPACMNLRVV
jgi:hypothetical protein